MSHVEGEVGIAVAMRIEDEDGIHVYQDIDNVTLTADQILDLGMPFRVLSEQGKPFASGAVLGRVLDSDHASAEMSQCLSMRLSSCDEGEGECVVQFQDRLSKSWFIPPGWSGS